MGIPAYFSIIVKEHPEIITKLSFIQQIIESLGDDPNHKHVQLFLDSNSIIYDTFYALPYSADARPNDISRAIVKGVIEKIDEYISLLRAILETFGATLDFVYIAFDGVAPVAKLEQQRSRRYKSDYQSKIAKQLGVVSNRLDWSTAQITPGTPFMQMLTQEIKQHYSSGATGGTTVIVSGSNDCGEGEHKIVQYIREQPVSNVITIILGLDSDLFMLALNHLRYRPNMFLLRETPHFIGSIDRNLEPNALYLLDIRRLSEHLFNERNIDVQTYIFMCFLLGNDFNAHHASLNIRTGGIDKLLLAQGSLKLSLINDTINWHNMHQLIHFLAQQEESYIQAEDALRTKKSRIRMPMDTPENRYKRFDMTPSFDREIEEYINPNLLGWRNRYYAALFQPDVNVDDVCRNYLETLSWNWQYYTVGCPDWRFKYRFNYPPLLVDLDRYMSLHMAELTNIMSFKESAPISEQVQLAYVLPYNSLKYLQNPKLQQELLTKHASWYKSDCLFIWAYCRYFWEAHIDLVDINLEELEQIVARHTS